MSNSTITFDSISVNQSAKETTANAYFDASSPATLYGRRQSTTSGLTWGYYGGTVLLNGTLTQIANGTLALTASSTNYVEASATTGAVSKNTTGFTAGAIPLYSVVAGASSVTSYTDYRLLAPRMSARLSIAMSDANLTLSQAQAANNIVELTGTLTAARNIVVPLSQGITAFYNGTGGGFGLQVIGATGTGVTIANNKRAMVYADGTNVVRLTADA